MNLQVLLEEQFARIGVKPQELLGDENIAKISEVTIDPEKYNELSAKLKRELVTLVEAQNSTQFIDAQKDNIHKLARKGILDSIDSSINEHTTILSEEDRVDFDSLDSVKKNKFILNKYKLAISKAKEEGSNADVNALQANLESYKRMVETDYISKKDVESIQEETKGLKNRFKVMESSIIQESTVNIALKGNLVADNFLLSDLFPDLINSAVTKYLDSELFGNEKVKGKVYLTEKGKVSIKQDKSGDAMSIVVDDKILTYDEVVVAAVKKYNLAKDESKDFKPETNIVTFNGKGVKKDASSFLDSAFASIM